MQLEPQDRKGDYVAKIILSDAFRHLCEEDQEDFLEDLGKIVVELEHHHVAICIQQLASRIDELAPLYTTALSQFIELLYQHGGRWNNLMPKILDAMHLTPRLPEPAILPIKPNCPAPLPVPSPLLGPHIAVSSHTEAKGASSKPKLTNGVASSHGIPQRPEVSQNVLRPPECEEHPWLIPLDAVISLPLGRVVCPINYAVAACTMKIENELKQTVSQARMYLAKELLMENA